MMGESVFNNLIYENRNQIHILQHRHYLTIGIRRVRQGELPEGQEKVPWGTTSAHRIKRLVQFIP